MISTLQTIRSRAILTGLVLWIAPLFCAAPDAPDTTEAPADWRQIALHDPTDTDYYYKLLDVTEEEFNTAALEEPPRDRRAVITNKFQMRMAAIDNPEPLSAARKSLIQAELNKAATFLSDSNNAALYALLGHPAYAYISSSQNQLLTAFSGKSPTEILKMTAQFFSSILQLKTVEEAFADANKIELLVQVAQSGLSPIDSIVANALGRILFNNIDPSDKQALVRFVEANPPADPTDITVRNDILKEYVGLLQCRVIGDACKKRDQKKAKAEDTSKSADDKKDRKADAAPVDNKKIIEELEKVIAKLEGFALPGIQQAKRYLTRAKADERKFIKSEVARALDDNKDLKSVADAIRNSPIPQYQKFAQLVDAIYKEAGGF